MNPTTDDSIETYILDIMLRAGSRWVLWVLIALSLAAIAVMLERVWFFVQERGDARRLAAAVVALRERGAAAALDMLRGMRSMEAAVARVCLEHAGDGAAALDEHRGAIVELERARYEKWLAFLGTLGNNAPFIGLFGTVLGIVRSFHDLAGGMLHGAQDTGTVMTGIGQSLVATGVGLLVALPAVMSYNAFVRHVDRTQARADAIAHDIVGFLKTPSPAPAPPRARADEEA